MAVKIRLARRGRKKLALYDIIIADARSPRDGRFVEKIGRYNPNTNPATVIIDEDKALTWLMNGAQPTDTVKAILSYRGILLKKHLQVGVLKGAITQEEADSRLEAWKKEKEAKISSKETSIAKQKDDERKAKLSAEAKVNQARAEKLAQKLVVEESVEQSEVEETEAVEETEVSSQEESTKVEAENQTEELSEEKSEAPSDENEAKTE